MSLSPVAGAPLVSSQLSQLGELKLDALRPVAQRVCRLAAALFDGARAEVVIHGPSAGRIASSPDPADDDLRQGAESVSRVSVPIPLNSGAQLGELRVFGLGDRRLDPALTDRLRDLGAFVADEYDRLNNDEPRLFRELFEQAPGFMAMLSGPDYVYEAANQAYLAIAGSRPVVGLPAREVFPELIDQGFIRLLDEVAQTGRSYVDHGVSINLERGNGEPKQFYIDFVLQPVFGINGKVSSIFLQGSDVTNEKQSIEALQASQAKLEAALAANQAIFDHSHDVICTISAEGLFTQVSKHAVEVWGYSPEEMVGQPFLGLVHPDDLEATRATYEEIRNGEATSSFRHQSLRKDGAVVPMMWSAAWSPRHDAFFAIARDMSESVLADEKLRRAQKMEAVGRLTGGVAHDFNNLLTIIVGGAEALTETLQPGSEAHAIAELTLGAGRRGADLVSHLLTFSRRRPLDPEPLDTGLLLSGLAPLIRRAVGKDIEVRVKADAQAACRADRAQLESALLNLAINARDAMPTGGRLKIKACVTVLGRKDVENTAMPPGRYVRLSVVDSGQGMDAKTLERAIEPFFTTKAVGKGSGLGLAMVYGFVTQSGGSLRLQSRPGHGTRVEMFLPAASRTETAALDSLARPAGFEPATARLEGECSIRLS